MINTSDREILETKVISNRQIGNNVFSLSLHAPSVSREIKPGQFINVYLNDSAMLLPRPLSISAIDDENLILTYMILGAGTRKLSLYTADTKIKISTPLGNGFKITDLTSHKKILLIGGGIGAAPLLYLAQTIKKDISHMTISAILGDKDLPVLAQEFSTVCSNVFLASENLSFPACNISNCHRKVYKGTVMDVLSENKIESDYIFACGPKAMLREISRYANEKNIPAQISLDERMGCGFGACVGCSVRIKHGDSIISKKVCTDGPVFMSDEVMWND